MFEESFAVDGLVVPEELIQESEGLHVEMQFDKIKIDDFEELLGSGWNYLLPDQRVLGSVELDLYLEQIGSR